jgi:hypothetical protein
VSKKKLRKRIEKLEARVLSLECRPWPILTPPSPYATPGPLPKEPYTVTFGESVSSQWESS